MVVVWKKEIVIIKEVLIPCDNEVMDVATDDDEEESLLQVTPRGGLRMLDQLVFVTGICEEDRRTLFSIKERMETLSIAYKKQSIATSIYN